MARPNIEAWARQVVEHELRRPVALHDDGKAPSLYDLRIGPPDAPEIAIECVGAVDPVRTEAWNIGPGRGPVQLSIEGDWHVVLKPTARMKDVRRALDYILGVVESQVLPDFVPVDWSLKRREPDLHDLLASYQITSLHRVRAQGSGVVHLGMTGVGGWVDSRGTALPGWVGDFLEEPEHADVLMKLARSGAPECHAFIPISFGGVPWLVESYLGSSIDTLPEESPRLPAPVSGVWLVYGRNGLRWDGLKWLLFDPMTSYRMQ